VAGDHDGPFSSTRVRDAVAAGDVERAAYVLGRAHALNGVVEHGDKRGRTIGFPTANLGGVGEMLPPYGVYAVRVGRDSVHGSRFTVTVTGENETEKPWGGVMNVGVRPTVGGMALRIEAHLFDFDGDLYGQKLCVELVARLRGEKKFAGIDELKEQIARDAEAARARLRQV